MARLLIVGSGGLGKEVLECVIEKYDTISFLTNDKNSQKIMGFNLLYEQDTPEEYILNEFDEISVAIGVNKIRLEKLIYYAKLGMKLANIIHPKATVSKMAEIQDGCIISENSIIGPFAKLGRGCRIGPSGIVCHDCILEDGVSVSPKAVMGGTCIIRKEAWLCIGSTVSDNIVVGKKCVIGAGAVLLKDAPDNSLMVGTPAYVKKYYT